jgi:hypothetical protein
MHSLHTPAAGPRQLPYARTDYRRNSKRARPVVPEYERILREHADVFESAAQCRCEVEARRKVLYETYKPESRIAVALRIRGMMLPSVPEVALLEHTLSEFAWPETSRVDVKGANKILAGVIRNAESRQRCAELFDRIGGSAAALFGPHVEPTSDVALALVVRRLRLTRNDEPTAKVVSEVCKLVAERLVAQQKFVLRWLDFFAEVELILFKEARDRWAAAYTELDAIGNARAVTIDNDEYQAELEKLWVAANTERKKRLGGGPRRKCD